MNTSLTSISKPACYLGSIFIYGSGIHGTSDTGKRINAGLASYDRTGIKHGAASNFHMVSYDSPEFLKAGLQIPVFKMDFYQFFITLYIGSDASGSHMGIISQYGVSHIIIMRDLYMIEQYYVFKLRGISYYAVLSYECRTSYECTMPYLGAGSYDAGAIDISRRQDLCSLMDPDILLWMIIFFAGKACTKLGYEPAYKRKDFPWIGMALKKRSRLAMDHVKKQDLQILIFLHKTSSYHYIISISIV